MKMDLNYSNYNINFTAQRVAKAKNTINGVTTHFNIYKLEKKDSSFLKKLLDKVVIKDFYPELNEEQIKIWQNVFRCSIFNALENVNQNFLIASNNVPCGVISYATGKEWSLLDLSSIPIDQNKKANLSGLTLLYHLFVNAKKNNAKKIFLEAVKCSHGNPVQKYSQLGFKETDVGSRYVEMEADTKSINCHLQQLKKLINYKECKPKRVNLESIMV